MHSPEGKLFSVLKRAYLNYINNDIRKLLEKSQKYVKYEMKTQYHLSDL